MVNCNFLKRLVCLGLLFGFLAGMGTVAQGGELVPGRWSIERAWERYDSINPIKGCNYNPRTSVNSTEMWQGETLDPEAIDQELGWARECGYNSIRIFLQFLVWRHDPDGIIQRMEQFLQIAEKHKIKVMFVPFCDCAFAGREPYLGKQDEPVPGVHNSGWVPSPGLKHVVDRTNWLDLERYVKDLVGRFGNDRRVLIWDLHNEPGQSALGEKSLPLVAAAFRWSREAKASQPLTVGAWTNFDSRMSKALLGMSDVASFHGYDKPKGIIRKVSICRQYNRPLLCTEWLNRDGNNTFETILPIFAEDRIAGYHWGLVAGRTQTYMPWGSKKGDPMPKRWHHDVFRPDGTPYDAREFELLRKFLDDFPLRPTNRRWPKEKAWKWYKDQPWPCGFNYIPANAISYTEMWMPYAYDMELIDKELALAEEVGFNCLRVVLPFVVWEHDPEAFKRRLESFLSICDKRGIKVMFTLFDDCAFGSDEKLKNPSYGRQPEVLEGWYANGWTPSPGHDMARDPKTWPRLEKYVKDVISTFKDDARVWVWDLYNEPTNGGLDNTSVPLVEEVFRWARDVKPSQPLTVGQWNGNEVLNRVIFANSDIMTFHNYGPADGLNRHIETLQKHGRPIINTEWLNRGRGSLAKTCLPVFAEEKVGCLHWGLVNGKTQTHLNWGHRPGQPDPPVWQHDLYHQDHRPYDTAELGLFRKTIRGNVNRWSSEKANQWYAKQPWRVGCNFIPSTAINQLEMWQADTFDPETIDRELGWASKLGMNIIRVYLHDLAYNQDPEGFLERMDRFLRIPDAHGIKTMFVIFDDCWLAEPKAGKQPEPLPGVHNSGWLESPGLPQLKRYPTDAKLRQRLERYVTAVMTRFGDDKRILMWDLYNEPGGWWYRRGKKPNQFEKGLTNELCLPLLRDVYTWGRKVNPSQPLTSCWNRGAYEVEAAFKWADVITFHHYGNPDALENLIAKIKREAPHRPILCTEYLWRTGGDTFQASLPVFRKHRIGAINWGLVAGRTNTMWGWGSWDSPDPTEPKVWFHDILRKDGTPFDEDEATFLQSITKQGRKAQLDATAPQAARPSTYKGWRAYVLENDLVQLHVVPDIGGRVIQYALGEKEFFWINPALLGRTSPKTGLDPDGGWLNYGGDKLWPAPQGWDNDQQWPGPPDAVLDGQPYRAETDLDPVGVRLTSRDDRRSGIRFSRRIRLYPRSTRVLVEATMTNIDDKPRRWGIWAHTQLDAGLPGSDDYNRLMRAWCPINPRSHFDRGYRVIFGEKDNPSFEADAKRGLMKASYHYKVGKIGLDSHAGWVATVDGREGDVFVQRFKFEPDEAYPDGSSVEFWHNGVGRIRAYNDWIDMSDNADENPYVFESEVLSPFARLQPGESYTWTYDWYACRIGGDFPVVDCSEAGVVSEPLECRWDGGGVRLRGRFGVFHLGRLVLEAYNEKAEVLATKILDSNATPLKPVVLDRALELPPAASSVAVVLQDVEGRSIGEVDRHALSEKPR